MTLEEKLTALLRTICPRSYCDFAPTDTLRPYVTYQQIGGEALTFMDNAVPSKENAEIQVNVWSDSRLEAKSLIKQIEAALIQTIDMQARPVSASRADFDADMKWYGASQDFTIWADR
jgi:hypothetical protein